jgi:hypothetical protein
LLNIRDEILGTVQKTKYLLTLKWEIRKKY